MTIFIIYSANIQSTHTFYTTLIFTLQPFVGHNPSLNVFAVAITFVIVAVDVEVVTDEFHAPIFDANLFTDGHFQGQIDRLPTPFCAFWNPKTAWEVQFVT